MSYIARNQFGAFCAVCQSPLSLEEDDFDTCDACGGEGIGGDDDEFAPAGLAALDAASRPLPDPAKEGGR